MPDRSLRAANTHIYQAAVSGLSFSTVVIVLVVFFIVSLGCFALYDYVVQIYRACLIDKAFQCIIHHVEPAGSSFESQKHLIWHLSIFVMLMWSAKAVLREYFGFMGIWWNPEVKSNAKKYFAFLNWCRIVSMLGNESTFCCGSSLSFCKSCSNEIKNSFFISFRRWHLFF